jgi:hypothetical protein
MPDESPQSAPASAEKKHKLTPAMEAKIIKPAEETGTISDRSSKFLRLSSAMCAFALASLRFFDCKASAQRWADRAYLKFFGSNLK